MKINEIQVGDKVRAIVGNESKVGYVCNSYDANAFYVIFDGDGGYARLIEKKCVVAKIQTKAVSEEIPVEHALTFEFGMRVVRYESRNILNDYDMRRYGCPPAILGTETRIEACGKNGESINMTLPFGLDFDFHKSYQVIIKEVP